jgi:hypothetical protein
MQKPRWRRRVPRKTGSPTGEMACGEYSVAGAGENRSRGGLFLEI